MSGSMLKNTMLVVLGTLILAFATGVFILPMAIVCGGISGFAIIIDALVPLEYVSLDVVVFFLTWSLFLLGLFMLGKGFAIKTFISTLIYPSAVSLFLHLGDRSDLGSLFLAQGYVDRTICLALCALVGGFLVGLGCALTFLGGGSTGGVDIIAFCLCRAIPRLRPARVIFVIDALTILLGMAVIGDLMLSLSGKASLCPV